MRHSTSWPSTRATIRSRPLTGFFELGQRQQRRNERRGGMDRGGDVGVAEIEHVGAGGIDERGAERIDALAPAEHRRSRSAGERGQRSEHRLDRRVAAAGQRDGKEIHQRALGLMGDRRRQSSHCVPASICARRAVTSGLRSMRVLEALTASIGRRTGPGSLTGP